MSSTSHKGPNLTDEQIQAVVTYEIMQGRLNLFSKNSKREFGQIATDLEVPRERIERLTIPLLSMLIQSRFDVRSVKVEILN